MGGNRGGGEIGFPSLHGVPGSAEKASVGEILPGHLYQVILFPGDQNMIKISSMVGTPDLTAQVLAPYSGDMPAAFAKLAKLGYDGVEFMTKDPSKLNGAAIRRSLDEHNLELCQICTGHVWGEDKLGLAQPGKSLAAYEAAFQELADYAAPQKVRLTLEPITATLIKFVLTTQDGIEMCRRVNRPNFGLMLDVYHMNIEDVDIYQSFREAKNYTWLVHVCDNNRKWPGSAHLNFARIIDTLNEVGYDGFVSTEMLPWPDPDTSARAAIEHLRRFIPKAK
jgi:sugar phosphate isomerase/epimerase